MNFTNTPHNNKQKQQQRKNIMQEEYYNGCHNRDYTSKNQGIWNTILGIFGSLGGVPAVANTLGGNGLFGNGGPSKSQLETEVAYEKSKNYTDQTVIAALKEDEQNRKEIYQQVVANKEELTAIKTQQACEEKFRKELDAMRDENTALKIKDAVTSAVEPLKGDNIRLRDSIVALRQELCAAINLEAERRCCADNKIVCYTNATFAPKLISGYTADATTTTLAEVGNPLCGCCNNGCAA